MQLSHTRPVASARFDDPNLLSCAGLVPITALAQKCGLAALADEHLSVPTDKGSNAGAKITSLVAGMVAGADSIDDMRLLRHGAMATVFDRPYAPSTLGSFLREFSFGHVRQLDAVASRLLAGAHARTPLLAGMDGPVMVDLDDTIIEVHGYAKQGSGYGYSGVRGLNALIATVTTGDGAPVIAGQRLRKGACGSPRGAARMIADTLATVTRLRSSAATAPPLVRADSAFYGSPTVGAALRGGAQVSVTVRLDSKVKAAIAAIGEHAWTPIEYTDALYDEASGQWISRAEVAEIAFTAFSSKKASQHVPGRLAVRRIPDLRPAADKQATLFDVLSVAFPRVLHHHRPRHGHRRQDSPRPRHHRTSPRRPEELRPGPPTLGAIRRQRRVVGVRGDGVQPHPRRGQPHRDQTGQSPHRDHPAHPDQRAGTARLLRPPPHPAPPQRLALGTGLEQAVPQSISATTAAHHLTRRPTCPSTRKTNRNNPTPRSGDHPRHWAVTNSSKSHNKIQHHTDNPSVNRS